MERSSSLHTTFIRLRPRRFAAPHISGGPGPGKRCCVCSRAQVGTHDLFTMSKKRMKELMLPANVHYKKEGSVALGKDVARVIIEALKD